MPRSPTSANSRPKLIGADERTDVALVKIEATRCLSCASVMSVACGLANGWWHWFAVWSGNTVTAGIVSAKQRETGSDIPFIRPICREPRHSGGPLINIKRRGGWGQLKILSPVGSFIGSHLRSRLMSYTHCGPVEGQWPGGARLPRHSTRRRARELAEEYGLNKGKFKGAFVRQVVPGAPADKAGYSRAMSCWP